MKPFAALAALALTLTSTVLPALAARDSYVVDNAHLLSATATQRINQKVSDFNAQTGKEVVVDTESSLNGATPVNAAERAFAQNQVNGVLIYIAKGEKKIQILGDRASHQFFPSGSFQTIYNAMKPSFNQGNVDDGVNTGVDLVINQYRSHEGSLNRTHGNRSTVPVGATTRADSSGGFHMSWIWWLIALAVIFFVIRGIFRAIAGPRMVPPGYGGGPMGGPMGGPGYGAPMGGGFGGGGGGFWSGMLGGLGGAFLGNELFGNRGGFGGGNEAGMGGGDSYTQQDASGWQGDAGQADVGNAGGGGGFDGGGGGDSGGGW
ncbi:MAG: hypothetical protein NVS2B17_27350 [Candidatus Velthaea sp.]